MSVVECPTASQTSRSPLGAIGITDMAHRSRIDEVLHYRSVTHRKPHGCEQRSSRTDRYESTTWGQHPGRDAFPNGAGDRHHVLAGESRICERGSGGVPGIQPTASGRMSASRFLPSISGSGITCGEDR
jgi:hypothetical protein